VVQTDWQIGRYCCDYENQMTKVEKYVTDAWVTKGEYTRDALMRRIEKVASGTTIRYYHDGWRVIEETEGAETPSVERQYVFGNGVDEALILFRKNGPSYDPYYYLTDRLWTVEALVNDSGNIAEAYAYRAYGEPTIKAGAGNDGNWFTSDDATSTASTYGSTTMFTGRQHIVETGLYYFRMRTYEPKSGRFVSRDPVGYQDAMCLHGYVRERPNTMVDPYGKASAPPLGTGTEIGSCWSCQNGDLKTFNNRTIYSTTCLDSYDDPRWWAGEAVVATILNTSLDAIWSLVTEQFPGVSDATGIETHQLTHTYGARTWPVEVSLSARVRAQCRQVPNRNPLDPGSHYAWIVTTVGEATLVPGKKTTWGTVESYGSYEERWLVATGGSVGTFTSDEYYQFGTTFTKDTNKLGTYVQEIEAGKPAYVSSLKSRLCKNNTYLAAYYK